MGVLALLPAIGVSGKQGDIWLDSVVRPLGFGRLAAWLPGDVPPSLLYACLAVVITNAGTLLYNLSAGEPIIYTTNPYYALEIVLLPAAVLAARTLHHEYDQAMAEMRVADRATNPTRLLEIVPQWLPWSLFGIAVALQFIFPGPVNTYGVTALFDNFVVLPFVYTPIVIQFFTTYFAIELLAPVRLWQSDIGIDFLDPEGVGGLRPIGELIKKSYYYIAIGLVGYALITYAPFIEWGWEVSAGSNLLFTSIWIITIGGVAFGVFVLHRFMHREKREELRLLKHELQSHIENPYDVKSYEVPEEKQPMVDDLQERIRRVNDTSEYPATFSIWSQLLLSIALPKAIQYLLAGL
jgi:hypothetical protein